MSHTKRLLLLAILVLYSSSVLAQKTADIISVRGIEMVRNKVCVMFNEPLVSEAMIPPGFWLDHRFLEPNLPLQPGMYAKAPSPTLVEATNRLLRCAVLGYDGTMDPEQAAQAIVKYKTIEYAEPWYVMQVQETPNDPMFASQDALRLMNIPQAWDVTKGADNIVIAVVDNGVYQNHEDLKPSFFTNNAEIPGNMIDDDQNGYVDDYNGYNLAWETDGTQPGNTANNGANGHGTNVAGIVGAATNNGVGVAGIAYQCKIFPIKAAPYGTGSILYGYEGMIYAALQGFKIINCSWGSQSRPGAVKPYSLIDKSVIDFCTARGSLIVSSAGNHGNGAGGSGWLEFNYPSAYDGVMGVAECDTEDKVASTSGLGRNAQITAPSTGATTTVAGGGYTSAGISGTSFASPMGAGAAALVLAKWPNLKPRQIVALLQATGEDIKGRSPWAGKALHNRLNVLAAVQTDPTTIPGFRVVSQRLVVRGQATSYFANGDTLSLYFTVKNELGTSAPLSCTLRILDPAGWQAAVVTAIVPHAPVQAGETVEIGPFLLSVVRYQDKPCMMDLTFADGTYNQRQIVYQEPPATMITMMNDALSYSIGNRGLFAFGSTLANNMVGNGTGFGWRTKFEDLGWTGGLLFCTSDGKALKAYDNMNDVSDFSAVKPFGIGDTSTAILTDSNAGNREIGIRIRERCTFPSQDALSTVLTLTIENRNAAPLNDVAAGYFFDWDIGPNGANNKTRLAPEAIPESFKPFGVAELFYREDVSTVVVCAVASNEAAIEGQAAGMTLSDYVDDSDRLSDTDVIALLTSGTAIQTNTPGDACGVLGMRFPGQLLPGESRTFIIVIGVGETAEATATAVRSVILNPSSVLESPSSNISLWPNPALDYFNLSSTVGYTDITIVNVMGQIVKNIDSTNNEFASVNIQDLPNGMYTVVVESGNGRYGYSLCISR